MLGLFRRAARPVACDTAALGAGAVALRVPGGAAVPPGCVGVVADKGGSTRRLGQGERIVLACHETAFCFHPGPYTVDLLPYAGAPELGLRLSFAVDSPDPRITQQRFDLYLMSEAVDGVPLCGFGAAIEGALQHELALGNMDLPPCTSLDEWNTFRAALNQLCYMRFGVTIDDCVPVDLGDRVDYAALLLARAIEAPLHHAAAVEPEPTGASVLTDRCERDAPALRRLFLELPGVMCALRLSVLPAGPAQFRQQQALLQRLDQVSLSVATMPALDLSGPSQPLDQHRQRERARETVRACAALDEAWALLARLQLAPAEQVDALFADADRIVANLEFHCQARRLALPDSEEA